MEKYTKSQEQKYMNEFQKYKSFDQLQLGLLNAPNIDDSMFVVTLRITTSTFCSLISLSFDITLFQPEADHCVLSNIAIL